MNKNKVGDCIKDLKIFFIKKDLTISEARESIYRMIDYIDENYDEDERDKPFKVNGNGFNGLNGHAINNTNNYKDKPLKKNKLEAKTRLLIR